MSIITYAQAERVFKYFHLSSEKLGSKETFVFTPRVPRTPYVQKSYRIEDDFTERISLATSISGAIDAYAEGPYVYVGDFKKITGDDIKAVDLMKYWYDCPFVRSQTLDETFDLAAWFENALQKEYKDNAIRVKLDMRPEDIYSIDRDNRAILIVKDNKVIKRLPIASGMLGFFGPRDLPEKYRDMFYACVPDANITDEKWATERVKMMLLGIFAGEEEIRLTNTAIFILTKLGYLNKDGKFVNVREPKNQEAISQVFESWRNWRNIDEL